MPMVCQELLIRTYYSANSLQELLVKIHYSANSLPGTELVAFLPLFPFSFGHRQDDFGKIVPHEVGVSFIPILPVILKLESESAILNDVVSNCPPHFHKILNYRGELGAFNFFYIRPWVTLTQGKGHGAL